MSRLIRTAAVALAVLFCLGPFLWQLVTSLKPDEEMTSLPPILPTRIDLSHYSTVLLQQSFGRALGNSLAVACLTTLGALVLGSFAAFALARLRFRGKRWVLGGLLAVSIFPQIATVSPLYVLIRAAGLRDTWAALVVPYTAYALPLAVYTLAGFFREIPDELRQAALVDGCSGFGAFWRILLPLATPGLFTTAILVFIFAWNEFLFALVFTATDASRTVPVAIAMIGGLHAVPWGEIAAASVVVTVPLIVMVLVFQRRIVSGLTAGAVKG